MKWFTFCLLITSLVIAPNAHARSGPSPEELVAKAMDGPLEGFRYNKRLAAPSLDERVLLFSNPTTDEVRLVVWTERSGERFAGIPTSPMNFKVLDVEGRELETIASIDYVLILPLTQTPRILVPERRNTYLRIAAAAERVQPTIRVSGPRTVEITCTFTNPLDEDLLFTVEEPSQQAVLKPGGRYTVRKEVAVGRPDKPMIVAIEGMGIVQQVVIEVDNPLSISLWPEFEGAIAVRLANPGASPLRGRGEFHLVHPDFEGARPFDFEITMTAQERFKTINIPLNFEGSLPYPIQAVVTQRSRTELGKTFRVAESPPTQFLPLPRFRSTEGSRMPEGYEGRSQGQAHWNLSTGIPPEGAPVENRGVLMMVYSFRAGGTGFKVRPSEPSNRNIPGSPTAYGLWVHGDNSLNFITCGIRDANDRIFRPDPIRLDWEGWRYLNFTWPQGMTPPLQWDSVMEVINGEGEINGAVMINHPMLIYHLEIENPEPESTPQDRTPMLIDRRTGQEFSPNFGRP